MKDKIARLSFVALLLVAISAMFYSPTASSEQDLWHEGRGD